MAAITIDLPDNYFQTLQELADKYGISMDVLLRSDLEGWITAQSTAFTDTADYVLARMTSCTSVWRDAVYNAN